ncbi:MAG: transposase [Rubrivivax sp.]|nr:transposase [Rubrivivax sp.]
MARPLRLEFPGATYHVTSRGDRREPIYRDDADRLAQLQIIAAAMDRFDARVLAYCLMGNHYHLVVHTQQPNLSRLMRQINGVYTQAFNRRHGLVGHLFQGRFKAIVVDRDAYLVSLCRYVERNPVAAGLVAAPGDWAWSSYRAHVGRAEAPPWLDPQALHTHLLGGPPHDAAESARAAHLYEALAEEAPDVSPWQGGLTAQIFLGDAQFAARMQALASALQSQAPDIQPAQRRPGLSLSQCLERCGGRRAQALRMAHVGGGVSMSSLAREIGLSVSRVSRLIAAAEKGADGVAVEAKGKT